MLYRAPLADAQLTQNLGRGTGFKCHNRRIDTVGGVHVILRYLPRSMSEKVEIQGRIVASIVGAVLLDYSM